MAVGGLKKKRRIQLIFAAAALLVAAFGLIYVAMGDGLQYFRAPSDLATNAPRPNETFRLGGLVETGSVQRGEGKTVAFRVTDGSASVAVRYTGILPDLFAEGQGMIATGKLVNNTFEASEILAKHDEEYMPAEVANALKKQGIYKAPNGE